MKTIKFFILSLVLFGATQLLQAQPAASAPTPTHDATDVVSLFSDHYTTTGNGPEPQSWGGSAVTVETISGTNDKVLKSTNSSAAIFTTRWSAQTKGYVHVDVYSVSGGSFSFGLTTSYSNDHKWLTNFSWPAIPAGQWTGIDVPVIEFVKAGLDDAVNVQGIKLSGTGTYYVDNIYAYGDKVVYQEPAHIPVAPSPGHAAADVKSVFSDSYTNSQKGFTPQTFGGILAKIMPYESDENQKVIRLQGLGTSLSTIDTWKIQDKTTIHVDVYWDGSGGDGTFSFGMNASNWSGNNIVTAEAGYSWPVASAGNWVGFDIPVAVFSNAGLNVNQITQIKFSGSGNFYIDNLYAYSSDVQLDTDNTLKSLTVSEGTLTPQFSANIINYTVDVEEAVASITVEAETNSAKAQIVLGLGVQGLNFGANLIDVVVRAENGATKAYSITVNRAGESAIAPIEREAVKISVSNRELIASFAGQASVKLYSVSGQLLEKASVSGSYSKSLNQGIYILSVDGKAYKVLVK